VAGLAGALAAPSGANTTYTNLVNAPVAGNSVIILDDTVYGGATSQEAVEALNLGFDVVLNNATTWGSMTTANFATFRAIILGDPLCVGGTGPITAALANRTVWSPAVTGNILITGTDEALHTETLPGLKDRGTDLKRRGIYFAANNPAKTGAFVSLSCYYDAAPVTPQPLPLMDQFGTFMIHGQLGCYNNAHIVATAPGLTGPSVGLPPVPLLLDANLSGWGCSMHEGFDSWPANFYVFAIGQNLTNVYSATDGTHGLPYIIVTGDKVDVITNIQLGPKTATNPVGTNHTVSATITPIPPVNTVVTFTVIAGPNTGATGTGNTNVGGVASWTYPDTKGPGCDYIVATWTDATGVVYTSNTVTKCWTPCPTPVFTITGPPTTCQQGVYCVTPPPPGATYLWSVTNGTIVGPNNGPCVTINWNPTGGGVVTVTISMGPACPPITKEIGIQPCDITPKPCCDGVMLTATPSTFTLGPGGSATFAPTLSVLAGLGPIIRVVGTVVTTNRTFTPVTCGTAGPVNSYLIGWGASPGFNASIPLVNAHAMVWKSVAPAGVNLGAGQAFPMNIQFPPIPGWPCADSLSFCVRYEFTDVNCRTCEVTVCYRPYVRKGSKWHWDVILGTAVVGGALPGGAVISARDPDGNLITDMTGSVSLSIKPGTGSDGATLTGTTTGQVSGGRVTFNQFSVTKAGVGYVLTATPSDDPEEAVDSNPFNVVLTGQIPIFHTTTPITIDGNITAAEWNGAPIINLNQAVQDLLPGHWSGLADYSAQVKLKWDTDNLYFAAFVADDVVSLPASPVDPTDLLGRDGLQMFLSLSDHQHNGGTSYTDSDFDVRISADPPAAGTVDYTAIANSPQSRDALKGVLNVIKFVRLAGGYAIEGSLPWKQPNAWSYTPAIGGVIGFNLQGRDNDSSAPGTDTLMSLTGLPGAETTPNTWTSAILLGGPPLLGDINQDGVVDSKDVILATQLAGGLTTSTVPGIAFPSADVNGDGVVDMKDAVKVNRIAHGL
jgi:hypothetical protein